MVPNILKLLVSLDRALETVFLQLYANNLSRSYRCNPADACADSEIQITTMVILLLGGIFLAIGSLLFPDYLSVFVNGGGPSVAILVAMTVGIAYCVHLRFGRFERAPERAKVYQSVRSRMRARALFWSIAFGWLAIAIVTLAHKHL